MTLASETVKVLYNGDGVTDGFAIPFVFWADTDIEVIHRSVAGVETTWVDGTHYNLTGGGGSTGTATVEAAYIPASGEKLLIKSARAYLQEGLDLPIGGPFPASSVEQALDQVTRLVQQHSEALNRSLKLQDTSTETDITIPDPSTRKALVWNASGNLENTVYDPDEAQADADAAKTAAEAAQTAAEAAQAAAESAQADAEAAQAAAEAAAATITVGLAATNVLRADHTEANTASATTTALGTTTNQHFITGTTTITGFTGTAGVTYHCRTQGILTLTHHATNLIITQTGASITTAAGDTFDVQMITGSTCRIVNYQRASGAALVDGTVFSSSAENIAGTVENKAVDPLGIREAFNCTGTAPVFACRAWVNFDGTGTPAIKASGNVTSITDNGTGDYTINFTTALPDANYAFAGSCNYTDGNKYGGLLRDQSATKTSSALQIFTGNITGGAVADVSDIMVMVFR